MSDLFISYRNSPERRKIAKRLATLLRNYGMTVWWDYGLEAGKDFEPQIIQELDSAQVVIVLWCFQSIESEWVTREARKAGNKILPVLLQSVSPPAEFSRLHAFDLRGWRGNIADVSFHELTNLILSKLNSARRIARDTIEELEQLPSFEPLPLTETNMGGSRSELEAWLSEAQQTLVKFRPLYGTMKWEQHESQRSTESFMSELRALVNELPPFPSPYLRREPSPIHRQGLLESLREYVAGEIHEGKPIPNSYRLEPIVSELAVLPGIVSVCWSNRGGSGIFPEGEIIPMTFENPG